MLNASDTFYEIEVPIFRSFHYLAQTYFWYFALLGLFVPFLGLFLDGRNFDSRAIGEILAIATATKIFGPAIWANLADKSGKQLGIVKTGGFLALVCFVLLFWTGSYWGVTICLALNSLFWTAILPQLEVLTLKSVKYSPKIYSRIRLWGSIGFIVIAVSGSEIIARSSSEAFVWIGCLLMLFFWGSTYLLKQPRVTPLKNTIQARITPRLLTRAFVFFFLAGLMLQIGFGPYNAFFALHLKALDYSGLAIGLFISIGVVAEILIFIYAGKIFKHVSVKSALVFSLAVTSVRWFLQGYAADSILLLSLSQILHAFSFGLYHCASIQFIQSHFDNNQQSRGQAIYIGGVYGIGGAVGAYWAGILWQNGVGVHSTFNMAIAVSILGALFALLIPKVKRLQ